MLAAFNLLLVRVDVKLFDLLLLPLSLSFFLIKPSLLFIQLLLLFTFGALLLKLPSLLFPFCSLLFVFFLALNTVHKASFNFSQPFDVLYKSLLNLIFNHACVKCLLSVILLVSSSLDFFIDVVFIFLYLIKQRLIISLRSIKNTLLTFCLINGFLNAIYDFLDLRQFGSFFLLLLPQAFNLRLNIFDLLQGRLRLFDLCDFCDELLFVLAAQRRCLESALKSLLSLFQLV